MTNNTMQKLTVQELAPMAITEKTVKDFLFSSGTKLTDQQQAMFLQLAVRNQLDPFKREIYAIPYGSNFSIVTGYQTYIKRADETGLLDGWNVEDITEGKKLVGARITIHRKDWNHPFVWDVSLDEFNKQTGNWKTMPGFMIRKVVIGQGFRLAFPETLSSLPYLAEEIDGEPAQEKPAIQPPKRKSESAKPENGNGDYISEGQQKRLWAIVRECHWTPENLKKMLSTTYGIEHSNEIPRSKYDEIVSTIQAMPLPGDQGEPNA